MRLKINGRPKWVIAKPPNIKKMVATNEGHCKLAKPIME
jgi:hypothetical protein